MVTALNGAEQRRNTNESHMCLVLAWRQVVQRPTAFFRSRGQHPLTELLSCRHASEDSLSDRKRIQSPNLSFLRTGFHKTYVHCEALHASMQPMTASKANSNFKSSSAPVWIDCDSGSDDALGIACLLASPEEHVDKPILAHHVNKASAGILLAARANVVGISSVRGNTVRRDTMCTADLL